MSRKIRLNNAEIDSILLELRGNIKNLKFQDKELKVSYEFKSDDKRAKIIFTNKAWMKTYGLVHEYTSEVEWHGTIKRLNHNTFVIEDILIFPHKVTATTVVSDQAEYSQWLNSLEDDTFNALRLHGHSHVDMGVSPSSIDLEYRRNILNGLPSPDNQTDSFYIFIITNKRHDISAQIYDLSNNALYDTNEIDFITEIGDGSHLEDFIEEAHKVVTKETYVGYSGCGYNGYNGYQTQKDEKNNSLNSKNPSSVPKQTSYFDDEDDESNGYYDEFRRY